MNNQNYYFDISNIKQISYDCPKCGKLIERIKVDNNITSWDYVIPRSEKCPNCGTILPRGK